MITTWPRAVRQARAVSLLVRANFSRLTSPLKVNLCLTYWCQYRCKTCNIWRRSPEGELSTDELMLFVEKNREVAWLDITGGEIFLRKDVGDVLDAIAVSWKKLSVLHFATNG